MKYDTLDFTVTIQVPQNAVTTGGVSVILALEDNLLAEEMTGVATYFKKQVTEAVCRQPVGGVPHGVTIEIGGIDIIWADDECEVCDSCPCICGDARQRVGFGCGCIWEQGDTMWVCIVCGHTLPRDSYATTADLPAGPCV